jgi:NAD(P)-dependent dehydrogenase (short-subunit alcohol dehydrogenase family)
VPNLHDPLDITGTRALVVGASVRGLAVAAALEHAGASVVLADAKPALDAIDSGAFGDASTVTTRPVDLADPDALLAVADEIDAAGGLDAAFAVAPGPNGAGYLESHGRIESVDAETWRDAITDALHTPFHLLRAAAGPMRRRGAGSIVVVTSTGARRTDVAGGYGDVAGGAGIVNAARQAAFTLAPEGIRVNVLVVGPLEGEVAAEELASVTARIPAGRLGSASDLTGIVRLLAAPASSYLTGAIISLDGGALTAQNAVPGHID